MAKTFMIVLVVLILAAIAALVYITMKKKEGFYETAPRVEGYNDWEYENEAAAYIPH